MTKGKEKGNWFETETSRAISLWLTAGADNTQLIPSRQSGGAKHLQLPSAAEGWAQVGDLSPNGDRGRAFREVWGIECKRYKDEPEWWNYFNSKWMVWEWWGKLLDECAPFKLCPMLVMKANRKPVVVMVLDVYRALGLRDHAIPQPVLHFPREKVNVYRWEDIATSDPAIWIDIGKRYRGYIPGDPHASQS